MITSALERLRMPGPSLISDYLRELSAQLPGQVVEELADGLNDTCEHYLDDGLDPDAAASAALAEFGDPQVIIAAFTRLSSPQRAARRLLLTGPVIGACWGAALITSRAWTWAVPNVARLLLGVTLLSVIGLLAAAAFGRQYRAVGRVGIAGCIGIAAIDTADDHHGRFCYPCAALASHPGHCGQRSPPRLHHTGHCAQFSRGERSESPVAGTKDAAA